MSSEDRSRARGLMAARLGARTGIDKAWQQAFAGVEREAFLPERVWFNRDHRAVAVDRTSDPETWWSLVDDEERSVIIQLDDGRQYGPGDYSSSSTMPLVMARMPAMMPDAGRVLEVGSGSGYNAAIMAHRYGAENVVSIEVDPDVAAGAAGSLARAGCGARVVVGDGVSGEGVPPGPYDAIIATCGFKSLPNCWLELCPQGRIVLPWSTRWSDVACLKLDTHRGGAEGRFVHGFVFMDARSHRSPKDRPAQTEGGDQRTTQLDPRLTSWRYSFAAFAVGVLAPGLDYHHDADAGCYTVWDGLGSWAVVDAEPGPDGWGVREYGLRQLWRMIEFVYKRWQEWDGPSPDRFGVSLRSDGGLLWLDSPDVPVATLPVGP
jgi:protein-L-isoaspartate O-methyltransferase